MADEIVVKEKCWYCSKDLEGEMPCQHGAIDFPGPPLDPADRRTLVVIEEGGANE